MVGLLTINGTSLADRPQRGWATAREQLKRKRNAARRDASAVKRHSANGRGLLLVIDTKLDRVRLEVSTSLEGIYTDAFVAYIQHRQLVPFFQAGRVADGIVATITHEYRYAFEERGVDTRVRQCRTQWVDALP